ncbi:hypothetical protein PCL1606_50250 [Pseudomonas chlororaphis]|uniref:Uncharacterized protein n=1 Tax=Pseudomonas chlororaphis TaxID=587753 RepID=A0A0D5Y659_9PSED|nr:hypothetical protein PCL1606_50250 [Pseudomonas chlororaphis]
MCFEAVHSSLNRPRRHPKRYARTRPNVGPAGAPCGNGSPASPARAVARRRTGPRGPFPRALPGGPDL